MEETIEVIEYDEVRSGHTYTEYQEAKFMYATLCQKIEFEENAEIKARAVSRVLKNDIVLADDSGLEIDYLDKAPGIYSARFAGEDTSYDVKNRIFLDRLEGVPEEERTARFCCAVAAVFPDGTSKTVRGTIEGRIAHEILGENGFGYDPIFYVPEYGCTTGEMSPETEK